MEHRLVRSYLVKQTCEPRTFMFLSPTITSSSARPRAQAWTTDFARPSCAESAGGRTSTELVAFDVTSEERHHGAYAGVRVGEAQNPGPADHESDSAQDEPWIRIHEAGDAVPGSLDPHHARIPESAAIRHRSSAAQSRIRSAAIGARSWSLSLGLELTHKPCVPSNNTRAVTFPPGFSFR